MVEYPPDTARQPAHAAPRGLALVRELKPLRGTRSHGLLGELDAEVDDLYDQVQEHNGPAVSELLRLSSGLGSLLQAMDGTQSVVTKVLRSGPVGTGCVAPEPA